MREIFFRGKCVDNGEWVCSRTLLTVFQDNNYLCFIPKQGEDFKADPDKRNGRILVSTKGNYYQVDNETIGQYTGLTDKNGKKIFEGDIVKYPIEQGKYSETNIHEVVYETRGGSGYFGIKMSDIETWGFCLEVPSKLMTVVGNIHDNPELLEELK